jgi:hypothetical protein
MLAIVYLASLSAVCLGSGYVHCYPQVPHCSATQPCPAGPYTCKGWKWKFGCYQGNFPSCIVGRWQCS